MRVTIKREINKEGQTYKQLNIGENSRNIPLYKLGE
jgi:hypothetical protein